MHLLVRERLGSGESITNHHIKMQVSLPEQIIHHYISVVPDTIGGAPVAAKQITHTTILLDKEVRQAVL